MSICYHLFYFSSNNIAKLCVSLRSPNILAIRFMGYGAGFAQNCANIFIAIIITDQDRPPEYEGCTSC